MSFETVDAFLLLQQKRLTDVLLYDSWEKFRKVTGKYQRCNTLFSKDLIPETENFEKWLS